MMRPILKWIGLTTVAAALTTGCVARAPQRSPGPTGTTQMQMTGSTTGDADACAVALGNTPGAGGTGFLGRPATGSSANPTPGVGGATGAGAAGRIEATANGILIGNVALVALPTNDHMGLSPTGPGAPAPGPRLATPAAPPAPPTAPGTNVTPGGTTPPVTRGATTPTGMAGTFGAGTGSATATGPGTAGASGTAANSATGPGPDALTRIRTACTRVAEIRVVTAEPDRARLGAIAASVRHGQPISAWMTEIATISRRATTVVTGSAATPGQTMGPATTPPATR